MRLPTIHADHSSAEADDRPEAHRRDFNRRPGRVANAVARSIVTPRDTRPPPVLSPARLPTGRAFWLAPLKLYSLHYALPRPVAGRADCLARGAAGAGAAGRRARPGPPAGRPRPGLPQVRPRLRPAALDPPQRADAVPRSLHGDAAVYLPALRRDGADGELIDAYTNKPQGS